MIEIKKMENQTKKDPFLTQRSIKKIKIDGYKEEKVKRPKFGKLFFGIIFVLVGLFYFSQSTGWTFNRIDFQIQQLWPLIIIFWGLSMTAGRGFFSAVVGILTTVSILAIVLMLLVKGYSSVEMKESELKIFPINITKEENIKKVSVEIENRFGNLIIESGAESLIKGELNSNFMGIKATSSVENNIQKIYLENKTRWRGLLLGRINKLNLNLNSNIPLALDVKSDASSVSINTKDILAESANIDIRASSLNLILGDKLENSSVNIKAEASSINITLPKSVGIKIRIDQGLAAKKLIDNFIQIAGDIYQTEGYENAEKKIEMDFSVGTTNLEFRFE